MVLICRNTLCKHENREIPDGEQVCVWDTSGSLKFFFVCQECYVLMEQEKLVEDIDISRKV